MSEHEVDGTRNYFNAIGSQPLLTLEQEQELGKEIAEGRQAESTLESAILDATTRRALEETAARGRSAIDRLVISNLRLVVHIAKNYRHDQIEFVDFIQAGNIGLIRAAETFDHTLGVPFAAHARWSIRAAMARTLAWESRVIRVPEQMLARIKLVRAAETELTQILGRTPTGSEIAAQLGLTRDEVAAIQGYDRHITPIDSARPGDQGLDLTDIIADEMSVRPCQAVERSGLEALISRELESLPELGAEIIRLRFGLIDGRRRTLEQVAEELGMDEVGVRRTEVMTLADLRRSDGLTDWWGLAA